MKRSFMLAPCLRRLLVLLFLVGAPLLSSHAQAQEPGEPRTAESYTDKYRFVRDTSKERHHCVGPWRHDFSYCENRSVPTQLMGEMTFGLLFTATDAIPSDANPVLHAPGILFDNVNHFYLNTDGVSALLDLSYSVGGGALRGEGGGRYDLMFGWAFPVAPIAGFVLRFGSRAEAIGNHGFYDSLLEIPSAQFGFQLMGSRGMIELGVRSGLAAMGRVDAEHFERKLDGGLDGATYLSVHVPGFHLEGELDDLSVFGAQTPSALLGKLRLCGVMRHVSLCFDGRVTHVAYPGFPPPSGPGISPGQIPAVTLLYGGVALGMSYDDFTESF